MIVYELCDIEKRTTFKSQEDISEALIFSYVLVLHNTQHYAHEEFPGTESEIQQFATINSFAITKFE